MLPRPSQSMLGFGLSGRTDYRSELYGIFRKKHPLITLFPCINLMTFSHLLLRSLTRLFETRSPPSTLVDRRTRRSRQGRKSRTREDHRGYP